MQQDLRIQLNTNKMKRQSDANAGCRFWCEKGAV